MATDLNAMLQQARGAYVAAEQPESVATASAMDAYAPLTPKPSLQGESANRASVKVSLPSAPTPLQTQYAEKYGEFYLSSPNGDRLAKLRAENEARVQQKKAQQTGGR